MTLWIILAFLTGGAMYWLIRPQSPARAAGENEPAARAAGYRGALAALERDQAEALIGETAAAPERAVIARALIAESAGAAQAAAKPLPRWIVFAAVAAIPIFALVLYLFTGLSEGKPSALVYREKAELESLWNKWHAAVDAHPNDPQAQRLLGLTEAMMGRYGQAAKRFEKVLSLGPHTSQDLTLHAELLERSGGKLDSRIIPELDEAISLDPANLKARIDRAMLRMANGDFAGARADWLFLADAVPEGNPAKTDFAAQAMAAERAQKLGSMPQTGAEGAEQQAMIQGMVDGLAAKLQANPQDLQGWLRLIHAYIVLGEQDKAQAAQKRALDLFGADAQAKAAIEGAAR